MANFDLSIFQQVKPRSIEDYSAQADEADTRRMAMLQGRLQYQDALRARDEDKAMRLLYEDPNFDINNPFGQRRAMQVSPRTAIPLIKANLDAQKTRGEINETEVRTKGMTLEQGLKVHNQALQQLADVDSPEKMIQWASDNVKTGGVSMQKATELIRELQQNPDVFAQRREMLMNTGNDLKTQFELKAAAEKQAESVRQFGITSAETARNNRAQNGVAQGNLSVAQQRLQFDKTQPKGTYDPALGVIVDPRTGVATQVTMNGEPLAPKKPTEQQAKVSDAKEAIALIDMADPLVRGATGSYAGVGLDMLAGAFGKATDGATAAAKLKAIEGMLVSKMPKMSGPQSDKDVALYRQMAANIGDPTVPREQKMAALDTVREIQERYVGLAPGSTKKTGKSGGAAAPFAPSVASGGRPPLSSFEGK